MKTSANEVNEGAIALLELLQDTTLGERIKGHNIGFGELSIFVDGADLLVMIDDLRRHRLFHFTQLVDITAIDHPGREKRFDLVYHLLSISQNMRLRIIVEIGESEVASSICEFHPSANWYEREVFDMFGINFSGHPDMRRILTDYGFEGHPLRKDFPMSGHVELRYDEVTKSCVYEPVSLVQDYRSFDFLSPWEGAKYVKEEGEKNG